MLVVAVAVSVEVTLVVEEVAVTVVAVAVVVTVVVLVQEGAAQVSDAEPSSAKEFARETASTPAASNSSMRRVSCALLEALAVPSILLAWASEAQAV